MKFLEKHNLNKKLARIASVQNPYNLLNRTYEIGLAEFAHRESVGLLAYSPLAFGILSGKYLRGQSPPKGRLTLFKHFDRYTGEIATATAEKYAKLALKYDLDFAQMSLAFVNSRAFVTSNIIGATSLEQLKKNIDSVDVELSKEVLQEINEIHKQQANPCP